MTKELKEQMKTKTLREIEDLIKRIKKDWGDWEATHYYYDQILEIVLETHEPKLYKRLKRLMEGASFWYA